MKKYYVVESEEFIDELRSTMKKVIDAGLGHDSVQIPRESIKIIVDSRGEDVSSRSTIEVLDLLANLLHTDHQHRDAELLIRQAAALLRTNAP